MERLTPPLAETLSAFKAAPPGTPLTTSEIADQLELGRQSTSERLERLVEHGILETKNVGASARVWWQTPDDPTLTLTADPSADRSDASTDAEHQPVGPNTIPADEILDTAEVGVFVLDASFDVVWANATTERYFGLDRAGATHRDKRRLVNNQIAPLMEDSEQFAETVLATYEDNTSTERFECRVTPGDGREDRWLEHRSTPIKSGPYAGGRIEVYYDITARKRVHNEARLLSSVSRSIAEAETLENGLRAALAEVCEWTNWEVGQAWVPTEDGVAERLPASYVTNEEFAPFERASRDYTFGPGDGIPGRVLEQMEPVWAPDVSAVAESVYPRTALAADVGLRASLGVPVIADGEIAVILEFYMAEHREKTEPLVETVTSIATKLGDLVARRQSAAARRQEAELIDRILETSPVGIAIFDADRELKRVNERLAELFGVTVDAMENYSIGDQPFFDGDGELLPFEKRPVSQAYRTGEPVSNQEVQTRTPAGDHRWLSINATPITDEDDALVRIVATVSDITRLKEQARRLEQRRDELEAELDEVFDRIDDAFYALDDDWRFTYVNDRAEEYLGRAESELLGRNIWEVLSVPTTDPVREMFETVLATQEPQHVEEFFEPLERWVELRIHPSESGLSVYLTDITDRKEREQFLEEAKARLEAATEAGAIGTWEWQIPDDEMVVGASFARTFGIDPDAAREGVPLEEFIPAIHPDDRERVEAKIEEAVESCGEYEAEYRVRNADGELRWVVARGHVECDDDGDPITFPGALIDITERKRAETELEQQRQRLAALNDLNGVVREITDAAIGESTREEIEAVVCERLAATDSYSLAWIGERDVHSRTVSVRTGAGTEGYLEEIEIALDPDDERSEGPTARAFRTGEIQTVQDVRTDPEYKPWRETAENYGFQSSAAIPVVHGETVYGVLNVYADRLHAFEGEERRVLSHLGETVGHAIAAAERKQALMSDEVVEVEFRIPDAFEALEVDGSSDGRITLDQPVRIEEREYFVYGTATADAVNSIPALVDTVPYWISVSFIDEDDAAGPKRFELRLSEPPVLSAIGDRGGVVKEAVIEDGDYQLRIHLPPSVAVREIIETVDGTYPGMTMVARRQIMVEDPSQMQVSLLDDLTDRQLSTLKIAYHSGYFNWPRDSTAEDIAESLDVSSPTVHKHLRKAQRKIFETILSKSAG